MHTSFCRYVGNILLVIGYYILLWGDQKVGLVLKCVGGMLSIPFAVKYKLWDVIFLCGFFTVIEITKLMHLLQTR
jgi:hypothetical protein